MAYRLAAFSGVGLDEALLSLVLDEHRSGTLPRLEKLWTYYRNPLRPVGLGPSPSSQSSRGWYRQAQEVGLPSRIVGRAGPGVDDRAAARREAVIENDIAWRVHTMVDFMVGKPVTIVSTARDEALRRTIDAVLDSVWESSGGIALLQDMATLAHVYGHVDLLLRIDDNSAGPATARAPGDPQASRALDWASRLRIEVIDPTRGIPILDPSDYRRLAAYIIAFEREDNAAESAPWTPAGLWRRAGAGGPVRRKRSLVVEVISADRRALFIDERQVEQQSLALTAGRVPVVHIQNISQPFRFEGLSEVEPLIPLQDELNTRLSDRASRVTLQSFKMYLAKGIEGFEKATVAPGQIWSTDNPDASVEAFGGDAASPSEESHIQEIREAMDKVSGVPPLAGGVVRARIGNLSSANALRITLMSLLGKTARKRVTYGRGLAEMCRLVLTVLDSAGVLKTEERDRGVRIEWPDPLPEDQRESVQAAEAKVRLGVDRERVLSELGYAPTDPGVT
jgi:hypothetical protein